VVEWVYFGEEEEEEDGGNVVICCCSDGEEDGGKDSRGVGGDGDRPRWKARQPWLGAVGMKRKKKKDEMKKRRREKGVMKYI